MGLAPVFFPFVSHIHINKITGVSLYKTVFDPLFFNLTEHFLKMIKYEQVSHCIHIFQESHGRDAKKAMKGII